MEPKVSPPRKSLLNSIWSGSVYNLEWMPEARDDLASLDKPIAQRILNKLRWLAENFEAVTPEPLTGEWKGLFKLRIGSYRALYTINRDEQQLTVHLVRHRRDIYKTR
mgnify:CR=1 FL=1